MSIASTFLRADRGIRPAHCRITDTPGVEAHADAVVQALAPWTGGHRMPNFTFAAEDYFDAYDEPKLARLRRAIRIYDPHGVMAIGHALDA